MKVILTSSIPSLGTPGMVVEVARGYARNFLIPQGKAMEANPGNLARFESQRTKFEQLVQREKEAAQGLAIDRRQLDLPEPIKTLGVHEVAVRLAPQVKANIKVEVVPQEA